MVYQFKIVLAGIKPLIWRRIQVPQTYSFYDLHVAIQDAMGWQDYHLHRFEISSPLTGLKAKIATPNEKSRWSEDVLSGWNERINRYFTVANSKAYYFYDYLADNWIHTLTFEGIFPLKDGTKYPFCLDGRRACPPEDCGGVQGYYELLRRVSKHKHRYRLKLAGGAYDPDRLDINEINFDNPARRLDQSFNR